MKRKRQPSETPGLCRVCRSHPATSGEHLIPKAAGNRGTVRLLYISPDGSYEEVQCSDGFFVPVLCKGCNNNQCSTYAQQYVELLRALEKAKPVYTPDGMAATTIGNIYPLRVVKQLITMLLCAVAWEPEKPWDDPREFVLDREKPLPPTAPRIYLYKNISRLGRIVSFTSIAELQTDVTAVVSELAWPPLGVALGFDRHPILDRMHDITDWGLLPYRKRSDATLLLPELRVNSHYPLMYGTLQEVERYQLKTWPTYPLYVPEGTSSSLCISALIRRVP